MSNNYNRISVVGKNQLREGCITFRFPATVSALASAHHQSSNITPEMVQEDPENRLSSARIKPKPGWGGRIRLTTIALAILLSSALTLSGQTFGEIAGEVRDPSGSVVAGSDLKLVSKATGAERTTVTNNSGLYSLPVFRPGVYVLPA